MVLRRPVELARLIGTLAANSHRLQSHLYRYEVIDVGRDTTGDFYGMLHYVRRVIQAITFKQLICEVESR